MAYFDWVDRNDQSNIMVDTDIWLGFYMLRLGADG